MENLSQTAQQLDNMNKQLQKLLFEKQQEIMKLNTELKEIRDSELWQAGRKVRSLRPEHN